ncbi:hypothetical protein V502_10202, partial [Pseudogymnoascus sp. VKM F-4520 (FW-2644)]
MVSDLKITTQEWTPDEKHAQDTFYANLRQRSDLITPWYELEEPCSEAGAQVFRDNVRFGRGGWPPKQRLDDLAQNISISSKSGFKGLCLRVFKPRNDGKSKGVYLHIHGGGWVIGSADNEDTFLDRMAQNTGYSVASITYRLAPKYPYPAAIEDCIDAALYLQSPKGKTQHGELRIIGGESAGAHLAMCVTFALRKQGVDVRSQLNCLVLNYGCYDLAQTPSSRAHLDSLILGPLDIVNFGAAWTRNVPDVQAPEISPLFESDFTSLPPAIFVVGTNDALLDDSLFAAMKWHMAGNEAELVVFPGSYHGFCRTEGPDTEAGLSASEAFIDRQSLSRVGGLTIAGLVGPSGGFSDVARRPAPITGAR